MKYERPILRDVAGYTPGEQPQGGSVIKLNTNENPYPPSPKVFEAMQAATAQAIKNYPDPVSSELRRVCAERYGYESADWVIAGNGMDELLAMALRTFVDPGETVLSPYPTYTLYEVLANLHGAQYRTVELDDDFQLTDAFFKTPARLCFLPRPNAPTGVSSPRAVVEKLCGAFDGVVVIDEAYADFSDDDCLDLPRKFDNVIVMRTFSKSFSLAGLRLGVAIAQPDTIQSLLKTKDSYNLNAMTQAAGIAAMNDYGSMETNARKVIDTRERLTGALKELGFGVPPSQSNFVLARRQGDPSAREMFEALRERGILVRYFDAPRLRDSLRISIGTDSEIDALISALKEFIA